MRQLKDANALLPSENVVLGSIYICISATMFAIAGTAVKTALQDISPILLVFWRNLLSLCLFKAWLFAFKKAERSKLGTSKLHLHILRSVASTAVLYFYFYAVSEIELATAILFLSTSPIFLPILALIFLGHKSDSAVWFGVLLAFFGVSLIVDPGFRYQISLEHGWGMLAGILSGLYGGLAQ